jgi:hypothetical protein
MTKKQREDEFAKLSPADQKKLEQFEADWERDGNITFERWGEKDPGFVLRLVELFRPEAVRRAVEDAVIDAGLTNADIRKMRENAKHKH